MGYLTEDQLALLEEGKRMLSLYGVLDGSRVDDGWPLTNEFREHLEAVHRTRDPEVAARPWERLKPQEKRGLVALAVMRWLALRKASKEAIWDVFDKITTMVVDILDMADGVEEARR